MRRHRLTRISDSETGSRPVERVPMLSEILGIDDAGDEVAAEHHDHCIP